MTDLEVYGVGVEVGLIGLIPLIYWVWLKKRGERDGD